MSMRNSSGKFSLPHFGRKSSGIQEPSSPVRSSGNLEEPNSPSNSGFGNGGGGAAAALDGLGKKLGKTIAHQSLLPGLGNKDLRVLQDIISAEKGVLIMTERLGVETQKAASVLPPFGAQEGPDLQDVLTHSSTLLNQLGTALAVFAEHSANLRGCYKRIREREEELDELRRRRRATGAKAESAEKKLAKMGPENKTLPSQTELLERLRGEMRQMDTDIINEESKIGDYKRQQIKEALSYKFGGLEELGEKMCIIGELGKLLLEEIPLEETPPGYGRAPYLGYDKTENAVNEATKCLATVKFVAGSVHPKAPGLPPVNPAGRLGTPNLPSGHDISAAEEFATYPGGNDAASPNATRNNRNFSLDESNPYGGTSQSHAYGEFGGLRAGNEAHVVFQGPTDDAIHGGTQNGGHDYEYEQQRQLDAENAWKDTEGHPASTVPVLAPPAEVGPSINGDTPHGLNVPWQPLNLKKDRAATPVSLHDGAVPRLDASGADDVSRPTAIDLPPPPSLATLTAGGQGTPSERGDGFYTPLEGPTPEPVLPAQATSSAPTPEPIPLPSPVPPPTAAQTYVSTPGAGKISAAAFRRGAKPRGSGDVEELAPATEHSPDSINRNPRRLPQVPGETHTEGLSYLPTSPVVAQGPHVGQAYREADELESPPPQYHPEANADSLR